MPFARLSPLTSESTSDSLETNKNLHPVYTSLVSSAPRHKRRLFLGPARANAILPVESPSMRDTRSAAEPSLDPVDKRRSGSDASAIAEDAAPADKQEDASHVEAEIEPEEASDETGTSKEKTAADEPTEQPVEAVDAAEVELEEKPTTAKTQDEPELETPSDDSWKNEEKEKQEQQQQKRTLPTRPATARSAESGSVVRRPFVPLASKSWRVRAMESNTQITRLMKAALLQTLLHAIRTGSVEGVKVAIERGVQVQYLDNRQRNLVMLASKCDTDARLHIAIILLDAGCDMNHKDQLGWSCLHYAWYVLRR